MNKRTPGRKRGLAVDVLGLIIGVVVLAASAHDNAAGTAAERCGMRLAKALVDRGFKDEVIIHGALLDITVEVVRRNPDDQGKGFVPQPGRWVVEQVNGTLMLHRRPARDRARPCGSEECRRSSITPCTARRCRTECGASAVVRSGSALELPVGTRAARPPDELRAVGGGVAGDVQALAAQDSVVPGGPRAIPPAQKRLSNSRDGTPLPTRVRLRPRTPERSLTRSSSQAGLSGGHHFPASVTWCTALSPERVQAWP